MKEYEGSLCLHCGISFKPEDDIVVCPDCGTPYHRSCWKESGVCENTELHETGGSWMKNRRSEMVKEWSAAKREEQEQQAADREREGGPKMIHASLYDGVRLDPLKPCVGLDPQETLEGEETLAEASLFVRTNQLYYLPVFRLMKRAGKKMSVNFVCLLFPHLYFANRKMWGMTIISLIADLLMGLPASLYYFSTVMDMQLRWVDVNTDGFSQLMSVCSLGGIALSVFWCLFANYFYMRYTLRKIRRVKSLAKKRGAAEEEQTAMILEAGGTSGANILVALLMQFALSLLTVMILTAI